MKLLQHLLKKVYLYTLGGVKRKRTSGGVLTNASKVITFWSPLKSFTPFNNKDSTCLKNLFYFWIKVAICGSQISYWMTEEMQLMC